MRLVLDAPSSWSSHGTLPADGHLRSTHADHRAEHAASDRELGLELGDPLLRRGELGVLVGRAARLEAAVDAVLAAPAVDRLAAEIEIMSNPRHAVALGESIKNPPTELRRVALSCRLFLLVRDTKTPEIETPQDSGHTRTSGHAGAVHTWSASLA